MSFSLPKHLLCYDYAYTSSIYKKEVKIFHPLCFAKIAINSTLLAKFSAKTGK